MKKELVKIPAIKIVLGGLICIALPILINKTILIWFMNTMELQDPFSRSIRAIITSFILMPLLYVLLYRKIENRKISEFSLSYIHKDCAIGVLFAVISIVVIIFLIALFSTVKVEFIGNYDDILHIIILIMGLVLLEEIFFRGIMYRIIEERWGTNKALIISGLIFGLSHIFNSNMNFQSLVAVVIAGLLLGVLYSYKKRLWYPISFHFTWNFLQVMLGLSLSGSEDFSHFALFKTTIIGNPFITGGDFGIENSVFALFVTLVLFITFYLVTVKTRTFSKIIKGNYLYSGNKSI